MELVKVDMKYKVLTLYEFAKIYLRRMNDV